LKLLLTALSYSASPENQHATAGEVMARRASGESGPNIIGRNTPGRNCTSKT
jgi:hypothetical protein